MKLSTKLPPVIFGTSGLGNIYEATPYEIKLAIVRECVNNVPGGIAIFDTAGKYGAGLALETLGKCLKDLNVPKEKVIISNKLGWYQTELNTLEPTFEPGVWVGLKNDAVQKISYEGILECFEQGNQLLGDYDSQMVSIHDPDEYLKASLDQLDEKRRFNDILEAYKALFQLKAQGRVRSVGIGAKDWRSIERISQHIDLDWMMIANSITLKSHPKELLDFVKKTHSKGVTIINSAVFNGGFLIGSDFYNYSQVDKNTPEGIELHQWRDQFFALCQTFGIAPAEACFNFGFNISGIDSIALSTSKPYKVKGNIEMATKTIPPAFWEAMVREGLLEGINFFNTDKK
ncbi:D-threo-aldose 1-dehydrogenase [Pedobacter sp. ok626]|uniref:aldo/keto reductase n=1 Tax=Pedobacter sp. ok626 TaxID=1761882 RepID=UPI000884510F|nr:aldo/keto reductase [Pedobacter sp. ok626]SDL65717.1 D-threo-aldose 1-dehydrogenase [Pedobacter sp. ok626]